jgi:hypothetical protein
LAQFNIDRRKEQADIVSPEIFEVILDQLEKEWFLLVRRAPFSVWPVPPTKQSPDETRS